jgi:hypothetical protein
MSFRAPPEAKSWRRHWPQATFNCIKYSLLTNHLSQQSFVKQIFQRDFHLERSTDIKEHDDQTLYIFRMYNS